MTTYGLYLESGPRRRKTMVHVFDLLGCVAVGPTTGEALATTPEAIRAYRRFLHDLGEEVDPEAQFETAVVEHVTEGEFLGNGSPSILFGPDREPLTQEEIDVYLLRLEGTSRALASWAAARSDAELDAALATGLRPAREMLRHVLAARASYLSAALGSSQGLPRIVAALERGELSIEGAFKASTARIVEIIRATTPEERSRLRPLPAGPRTLRQAIRRLLEHDWEHLAELSRRPGGPRV